ncbi:MAG: glycoside hydrolase family 31 protein [Chloroflexi bacterium]|nr:glycoside hydrolase family 31 protein [Chloroflexota bacterium]
MRLTLPTPITLHDPAANPLVFSGQRGERFQISVLDHDLIRVEFFPRGIPRLNRTWMVVGPEGDVPLEGRRRDDLSPFPLPDFDLNQSEDGELCLQTAQVQIDITLDSLGLRWSDASGRLFAADLGARGYTYDRTSHQFTHSLERREGEHYYGFGEQSGPLDKTGRHIRLLNMDAIGYDAESGGPLYKHFPFYITFVPNLQIAYGLFYDNHATGVFDLGREIDGYHGAYRYYRAEDGDLDYYLIYGPSIPDVVRKFSRLTGRMVLPPRWSLGYLGSTMSYTEASDAQEQLKHFVDQCHRHRIPCDAFHMSSGYTTGTDGKRYVFNWNHSRVPNPAELVDHFHQAGIHLAANIKPCLLTTHPRYDEVAEAGGFIRAAEQNTPEINTFWGGVGSHIDFTHPAGYRWWKHQVKAALLRYGIDSTWNDNNEYEIWDDEARCYGGGSVLPVGLLRSVQTLLMVRASYEAQRESRPNERPFVLSRSGCPGIQRYAQTWSGDNFTSWQTLRYNLPMGLGLSLSGAPNTGHDVGGFAGPRPDPELFVRWIQTGVFHPRFCIHSWNDDRTANEPWMYPEALPIIRQWFEFRYRLIPYLYTLLFEAARSGEPILRPLVYTFPHDPRCHTESFEFMLGPNLLIAPVLEDGARAREVYLPAGTDWCDFYSGKWHVGGRMILADAPLDRIPLFIPAGGMIPMGRAMRHIGEQPDNLRQVYVYPAKESGWGVFTLIEDDGISLDYQQGGYASVRLGISAEPDHITLDCGVTGDYPLPYDRIVFVLPPGEQRPILAGRAASESVMDGRRQITLPLD